MSFWRKTGGRRGMLSKVLLLAALSGLTPLGRGDASSSAATTPPAPEFCKGAAGVLKVDDYGTPSGSTRTCTGFPIYSCLASQYSG